MSKFFSLKNYSTLMQVMDNGKILYVDNNNQITTWVDPRVGASVQTGYYGGAAPTRRGPFFNSPPSPLSLMDVLTIGSGSALAEERKPLTGNRSERRRMTRRRKRSSMTMTNSRRMARL